MSGMNVKGFKGKQRKRCMDSVKNDMDKKGASMELTTDREE